ncbi:MAG: cation transporter [Planctomycetes bacterium]|nr:cation transporter [Planctomycetota bacterium]MCB9934791.1 cation transporter [Planctomycetota bacterium]
MARDFSQRWITLITLLGSGGLVVLLFWSYWAFGSQLALAQGADSAMDVVTAGVLAWTVAVSAQTPDKEHPFGHSRAEPIGGLVVAVIAGVLAVEVGRNAVEALLARESLRIDWLLVAVFGAKSAFKTCVFLFSTGAFRRTRSPAMKALAVDARNDVLVSVLAITGFFGMRAGYPTLDAWLALPVAAWIAWTGFELARDNIRYLMGEAPPEERQEELRRLAQTVEGVVAAHDLRAHFLGTMLQVHVHIVVKPDISVLQAHDIGEAVRMRIEKEEDVGICSVHIDVK